MLLGLPRVCPSWLFLISSVLGPCLLVCDYFQLSLCSLAFLRAVFIFGLQCLALGELWSGLLFIPTPTANTWYGLSCCISLFAEPRVGKAPAGKLKEGARSSRNCKHYSQQQGRHALLSNCIVYTIPLPWLTSPRGFQVLFMYISHHNAHAQHHNWSQL